MNRSRWKRLFIGGLLAVLASGVHFAADGKFSWRNEVIRDDLAAIWVEYPAGRFETSIPFVLYLKGSPGWLAADAGIVEGQGSPTVVFRSDEIEVKLTIQPDSDQAVIAGFRFDVSNWDVLLISGLGDPTRGPAVRNVSTLPKDLKAGGNPAADLYSGSADLRAALHYSK